MRFALITLALVGCGSQSGDALETRVLGNTGLVMEAPRSWPLEASDVTLQFQAGDPARGEPRIAYATAADEAAYRIALDEQVATCTGTKTRETLPSGAIVRGCAGMLHVVMPFDATRVVTCHTFVDAPEPNPLGKQMCRSLRKP